ncbi:hypothetical protein XENORESO_007591 [Xenotaenia resolanae]|uniref:Uncharacterized protein n=1 Tax=Xenotaenia resolanae TaxID=208358 RepID=A0ABV0WPX1_9TELE
MVRLKEKKNSTKRRIIHILQGIFCRQFSAFQSPPSGDSLESLNRHFPPYSFHNKPVRERTKLTVCLALLEAKHSTSKLGSIRALLTVKVKVHQLFCVFCISTGSGEAAYAQLLAEFDCFRSRD